MPVGGATLASETSEARPGPDAGQDGGLADYGHDRCPAARRSPDRDSGEADLAAAGQLKA